MSEFQSPLVEHDQAPPPGGLGVTPGAHGVTPGAHGVTPGAHGETPGAPPGAQASAHDAPAGTPGAQTGGRSSPAVRPFRKRSVEWLKSELKKRGFRGYSKKSKAELVEMIKGSKPVKT